MATEEFSFADGPNYTQLLFAPSSIMPFSKTLGFTVTIFGPWKRSHRRLKLIKLRFRYKITL